MNELFANWLHSGDKGLLRLVLPRETYFFLRAEKLNFPLGRAVRL